MKKSLIVIALFCLALAGLSFVYKYNRPAEDGIKWMTWSELQEAQKKQPRKVVVDVYTGWCGWCKRMDASTFSTPEIIKYVNDNFYAVKFDAEMRQTIHFKGRDYKYVASGMSGYNELAAQILNNQMSYPTSVYMDENLDEIFPVPGYKDPKAFEIILNYVATNSYKNGEFDVFNRNFKSKIK